MLLSTDHTASKLEGTTITGNRMKIHTVTHASRRKKESKCNDAEITRRQHMDLPGGPVVKNPPSNARDGTIPVQVTKIPHAVEQPSPCCNY